MTRAKALVAVLTTAEKINATISTSPGVPRLGLPPYEWWSEALHGVANSPGVSFNTEQGGDFRYATSFPQPITLGAAFDDALVHAVATVVSTEARAFSNAGRAGLDFWTPNINPFRDPRWGRGQETPGEDPFHLSSYVKALIAGLEGTGDAAGSKNGKYKKVVSTCKHFAGYDVESWNGNYRYQFDAQISAQDMVEYYLPPFQACARDARVGAFMCSYNAVNGVPTCADGWLLNDVLRGHWNWTGGSDDGFWVTSDCDAVQNVFLPHRWSASREAAAADSLRAGTDLNCGTYYGHHLQGAYDRGLVNDTDLDTAVARLYGSLVRLGYFDPAGSQPYRSLGWDDVGTPEAQQLAYTAAVEGTVLLKNDNGTLPLDDLAGRKVAVIGDWAAATAQLQGNYHGVAPFLRSPLAAAQQLLGNESVLYSAGPGYQDPTTNSWDPIWEAAGAADAILYFGGIDEDTEAEGNDRVSIGWSGPQLDVIGELALLGKPLVVVAMGGGQLDSSPVAGNPGVGALLWGGYPGQDGGAAILDVITGKQAPAGRLPVTQYPAGYAAAVPMTDMALRPDAATNSPGRTYRWYEGDAVFSFGYGLHYTTFEADMSLSRAGDSFDIGSLTSNCTEEYLDLCPFASVAATITNTGSVSSDYSALLFLRGAFGPAPHPLKTLVSYDRAHNISAPSGTAQLALNLTLGSLSRVDEAGNRVLYPGSYSLVLDLEPGLAAVNFTLTGDEKILDEWPAAPANRSGSGSGTGEVPAGYFVGGYGSSVGGQQSPLGT